jgi:hypothetical protein
VRALREDLDHKLVSNLVVTTHLLPESWDKDGSDPIAEIKLHPGVPRKVSKKQHSMVITRGIDIAGSGALLLILSRYCLGGDCAFNHA